MIDIRLQLLEPDRYPYLFKCLYGLLMLLPQSSAFISLRNRLNAVNSAGFLHIAPKPSVFQSFTPRRNTDADSVRPPEVRLRQLRRDPSSHVTRSSGPNFSRTSALYRRDMSGPVASPSVVHPTSALHSQAPRFQSAPPRDGESQGLGRFRLRLPQARRGLVVALRDLVMDDRAHSAPSIRVQEFRVVWLRLSQLRGRSLVHGRNGA